MELASAFHVHVNMQRAYGHAQRWRTECIADAVFIPLQQPSPLVMPKYKYCQRASLQQQTMVLVVKQALNGEVKNQTLTVNTYSQNSSVPQRQVSAFSTSIHPCFQKTQVLPWTPRVEKQKVSVFSSPENHSGFAQISFFLSKAMCKAS